VSKNYKFADQVQAAQDRGGRFLNAGQGARLRDEAAVDISTWIV
jgi:hypothetical protein